MIKSAKELVDIAVKAITRYQQGLESPIRTRNKRFNKNALGGIFKGNIITIGGASGSGKTYYLQEIETDIFNKELNPNCDNYVLLRVNWEMSVFKLLLRRLKSSLNTAISTILFNEPDEETVKKMQVECDAERNDNIFYLEDPVSPEVFYERLKEFLELHKDKDHVVVTIDHMALVKSALGVGSKKMDIDNLVEYCNLLTKEFDNVSFVLLTQLNRDIEGRTDVRFLQPRRSDIYASDTIFQISDIVIAIHNPDRLGHAKYMLFDTREYPEYDKYMTRPADKKSNFKTKGLIFHHYLKIRELDENKLERDDLHIEDLEIVNYNSTTSVEHQLEVEGLTPLSSLENAEFDENDTPFDD